MNESVFAGGQDLSEHQWPSLALCEQEVAVDLSLQQLSAVERAALALRAFTYGQKLAQQWTVGRNIDADRELLATRPQDFVAGLGAHLEFVPGAPAAGLQRYASFHPQSNTITVYTAATAQLAQAAGRDFTEAVAACVLHESFHFIESHGQADVFAGWFRPRFHLGRWHFGSVRPKSFSEAAAHGFSLKMLDLLGFRPVS